MATSLKPGAVRLYKFSVRRRRAPNVPQRFLETDARAADLFRATLSDQMFREHFCVFYLAKHNTLVGLELIAIGSSEVVYASPTEVFRGALLAGAHGIVLSHNHPSGVLDPSSEDDALTKRMYDAGEILGIPVIDHIIVVDNDHYSYRHHDRGPWSIQHA